MLITRPATQLQRYPAVIEAILNVTSPIEADYDFLTEALSSIRSLSAISQLKLFHASKGRGPAGRLQWYDLVSEEQRNLINKKEQRRQMYASLPD
jgi:RHO1 GDP-GTP exchange protein 1/2